MVLVRQEHAMNTQQEESANSKEKREPAMSTERLTLV